MTVELQTGPQAFDVAAASVPLPSELRDGSTSPATIRAIPCDATTICPTSPDVPVVCNAAMVCDPQPITIEVPVGGVVDFDALLSDARTVLRFVDGIEIVRVDYDVTPNSLTVPLPAVDVYWGPEGAAGIGSAGVGHLGTIPAIAPATAASGEMMIDLDGAAALSDYVLTYRRIRLFAETQVDLDPGTTFPEGSATITTNVRVRAIGRIIN